VERFATFAMVAIAGIGDMPDTITDRAVNIILRRRAASEKVVPFRLRRDAEVLHEVRDRVAFWVASRHEDLANAEPAMPVEDRAADVWEPLLGIADAAGGDWPERARKACLALSGEAEEDDTERSLSLQLLGDLRTVFGEEDRMAGATILDRLHKLDGSPWADWYGRLLNAHDLAKLLRPYGVRSTDVKVDGRALKGYRRDHLYDAWTRYLPSGTSATPATPATPLVTEVQEVAGRASDPRPATLLDALTRPVAEVAEVAPVPDCRCGKPLTTVVQRQHGRCNRCYVAELRPA
jgi:hypothetical protein